MKKIKRQLKIIDLIKNNEIETQEELTEKLADAGFIVTQATVSRDIRELKLTKILLGDGKQLYSVLPSVGNQLSERLIRIFRDGVVSMDCAQNILVVRTLEGMAMAVAASIDAMINTGILGTIAGDDTIFCIAKTEQMALNAMGNLNSYMEYSE